MGVKTKGFDAVLKDLRKVVDDKTIWKRFDKDHGKTVIQVVIGTAKAGIGPGNKKYPAWSKQYAAWKKKKVGKFADIWLTLTGAMLAPKNFKWDAKSDGKMFLVWTAPSAKVGTYAEVHQEGLPLGPGGPKKKRTWLHFENRANFAAVFKALEMTMDKLVVEFNLNRPVK